MSMKCAITVCQVPQAAAGPFVLHGDLSECLAQACEFGFHGVELFLPGGRSMDSDRLAGLLAEHGLELAALGTGAGWVVHQLTLTSADESTRAAAREFVRGMIDLAAPFGAPVIIGSMQGRHAAPMDRPAAMGLLADALSDLAGYAVGRNVQLLMEPLNRYESNLINTLTEAGALLDALAAPNVRILADLFHMNIEEAEISAALRGAARHLGHIHLADSNRRAAGFGHLDYQPIAEVLRSVRYEGYLSGEVLPLPDGSAAACQTLETFHRHFAPKAM